MKTAENDTVFTASNLKSLSFKIGANDLKERTYIISLEGKNKQNEFESIADYTLRVRRSSVRRRRVDHKLQITKCVLTEIFRWHAFGFCI
jgi:hypothetical protein